MSALKMSSASSSQRHPELVSLDGEMAPASDDQDEPMDQHVIDTSHYIPAEMDEKTEAVLSMSVCIDPHNPFDETTIKNFLKKIRSPLNQRKGYVACNQHVPGFTGCHFINLGLYFVKIWLRRLIVGFFVVMIMLYLTGGDSAVGFHLSLWWGLLAFSLS